MMKSRVQYKTSLTIKWSPYRASEFFIPCIFGLFKNKIECWGEGEGEEGEGGQNNDRPINSPKVITFSTDYKCPT